MKEINEEKENENVTRKSLPTPLYKYLGETCRSLYERGVEHINDMEQLKPGSHMLKHILESHEGTYFSGWNSCYKPLNTTSHLLSVKYTSL